MHEAFNNFHFIVDTMKLAGRGYNTLYPWLINPLKETSPWKKQLMLESIIIFSN